MPALEGHPLPVPHLTADLNDLARPAQRRIEGHAVESSMTCGPGRPDAEHEPALGDVVQTRGGHREQGGCAGVDRDDTRAEFDARRLGGQIAQLADGVERVRLRDQDDVDTVFLQFDDLVDGFAEAARVVQKMPVRISSLYTNRLVGI